MANVEITGPVFESGRHDLLRARLPLFALGWCGTTIAWSAALMLYSRLSLFHASLLLTAQLGVLSAAVVVSEAKASHVQHVVLAACVLLGLSTTATFAVIGGDGGVLLFLLIALLFASSPLLAWSRRAPLVLLAGVLLPWLMAWPSLHFTSRPGELAGAVLVSTIAYLGMLRWLERRFRRAVAEIVASEAARAAAENPAHVVFAIDEAGRFVFANDTLASLIGVSKDVLLGRSFTTHFTAAGGSNGDDTDLLRAVQRPEGTRWILHTPAGDRVVDVFAWASKSANGSHSTYGLGREVAALPSCACDVAAPVVKAPVNEFAVVQGPLRLIGDEEVRHLRAEVDRLRREVREQTGGAPGRPRRQRSAAEQQPADDPLRARLRPPLRPRSGGASRPT